MESEADRIGVLLMKKAGFNVYEAVEMWKRMDAAGSGQEVLEFASTHPSSGRRVKDLEEIIRGL
jgi:predicted Zn-dependent protease